MTRRKIVEITSTKKRDTMMHGNPALPADTFTTLVSAVPGTKIFLWCPTYRELSFATEENKRNTSRTFFKGVSERATITAQSGTPWSWRRIIFSTKGLRPNDSFMVDLSGRYRRALAPFNEAAFIQRLFQGTEGSDWNSFFNAKVDTNRVKLITDRTREIRSGNDLLHKHHYKSWIPVNKSLIYDDEESGNGKIGSGWQSNGIGGYGDVFVMDIFVSATSAANNNLEVALEATAYWHEK